MFSLSTLKTLAARAVRRYERRPIRRSVCLSSCGVAYAYSSTRGAKSEIRRNREERKSCAGVARVPLMRSPARGAVASYLTLMRHCLCLRAYALLFGKHADADIDLMCTATKQ